MTEEREAEWQATANLSPVSPSPVHTAAPLVVPALQDTVDNIDAMVAAAAASNGDIYAGGDHGRRKHPPAVSGEDREFVDDDNDDPYGDDTTNEPAPKPAAAPVPAQEDNSNDDYAKIFDSPVNPEEGHDFGADGDLPQDMPSAQVESNRAPPQVTATLRSQPSGISNPVYDPSAPALSSSSSSVPRTETGRESMPTDVVANPTPAPLSSAAAPTAPTGVPNSEPPSPSTLQSTSSLPPRPPQPNAPLQTYPSQHHPAGNAVAPVASAQAGSQYVQASAAPRISPTLDSTSSFPPTLAAAASNPPGSGTSSINSQAYPTQALGYPADQAGSNYQSLWEQFLADEKQYMSEAKWDRFPEGSRIFIGNLSSEKVSKRDVFDLFHRFGRLAQISLKSAYGFVQYHTVDEGHRAIDNLQDVEIKGRRIHLEVSKAQDKSKRERAKSPDRSRSGRDNGRRGDRFGSQRDEYRGGRNHSPRRNDHHDGYGRDRGTRDSGRGRNRSRSPGHGRNRDAYRRRSPSPYRGRHHEPELDLPKRRGADVPDVELLLQADVGRDFITWVEEAFRAKGLATHSMYLHPRIPREQVIQRQAVEGVHGVVDLNVHAQMTGKIPMQAFDRSSDGSNVHFNQYVDLDPSVAAEVLVKVKSSSRAAPYSSQPYPPTAPAPYPQGYGVPPVPIGNAYGAGAYPQGHQQQQQPTADINALLGKVDPSTLQHLLTTFRSPTQYSAPPSVIHGHTAAPPPSQPDLQSILSTLSGNQPSAPAPPAQYSAPYNGQASAPNSGPLQPTATESAHVQNIMAHLERYRQR